MHSTSLPANSRRQRKPAPATAPVNPPHLNFTFPDWYKQRTEPARMLQGWTPFATLHADYAAWCEGTIVAAADILSKDDFAVRLTAADDRKPETRLVEHRAPGATFGTKSYQLCFPRRLLPAIRYS